MVGNAAVNAEPGIRADEESFGGVINPIVAACQERGEESKEQNFCFRENSAKKKIETGKKKEAGKESHEQKNGMEDDGFCGGGVGERRECIANEIHAHGDAGHPGPIGREMESHGLNDVCPIYEVEAVQPRVRITVSGELADVKGGTGREESEDDAEARENGMVGGRPWSEGEREASAKDAAEQSADASEPQNG